MTLSDAIKKEGFAEIVKKTGLTRQTLWRYQKGHTPTPAHRKLLQAFDYWPLRREGNNSTDKFKRISLDK